MSESKLVCYAHPDHIKLWSEAKDVGLACYGTSFGKYNIPLVTHADYKAVEEENVALVKLTVKNGQRIFDLTEELASLKERVSNFVSADKLLEEASCEQGYSMDDYTALKERRRLALEALS